MAVVQDLAQLDCHELITESSDVPIQRKALDIKVGRSEYGRSWALVTSAGFHTNEPVLDDIDPSDTVLAPEDIQDVKDINRISIGLVEVSEDNKFDRKALLELDGDLIGGVRSRLGRLGQLPHIGWRRDVGILQYTSLVRDVEHVLVRGPRFSGSLAHWNLFLCCVLKQGLTTSESVVKF